MHEHSSIQPHAVNHPTAVGPRSIGSWVLLLLLRVYIVFLSPFFGGACKFYPSCSNYALQAVQRFGTLHGSWLAVKRLARCHPWHPGGYDPVPETASCTHHAHE